MKKIFYSMMAVALCACSQSDVDDMPTPPQPENNGLKFTVVDNGFVDTRVQYDDGENGVGTGITSKFEEGDEIGIFAIISDKISTELEHDGYVPADDAYTVRNVKLKLTSGVWTPETPIVLKGADLLFAYSPYDPNKTIPAGDGKPSFKQVDGVWTLNEGNNRFFVWPWNNYLDFSTQQLFKESDWMGAATVVSEGQTDVTLNMKHMRGMVEVITHKDVKLTDIKVALSGGSKYQFQAYFANETDANRKNNVYRILIAEHRNANIVYATITDEVNGITKKYEKEVPAVTTGTCFRLTIPYKPAELLTVGPKTLDAILTENYGANYKTAPTSELTSLRLGGTLSQEDWTTLNSLTTLQTLNLSDLENTEIPAKWLNVGSNPEANEMAPVAAKLTSITLPNKLQKVNDYAFCHCYSLSVCIPESSLQTIGTKAFSGVKAVYTDPSDVSVLKIPASVTTISAGAFENMSGLRKVVFQTPTAPTTLATDAFASMPKVTVYVDNKEAYTGKFPGKTVVVGPVLTADNYKSDYTHLSEDKGILGLCDSDTDTYWHSIYWNGEHTYSGDEKYGQYIDITLPEGVTLNSLMVRYATRHNNGNGVPEIVDIYTSTDGSNWGDPLFALTKDGNNLPTDNNKTYITAEKKTATAPFTKIRFAITKSKQGSLCGTIPADGNNYASASVALAELTIGEEIWID